MPFNLFLFPLIGGFVFIRLFCLTRFATSRLSGQRLIIWAALAGIFFAICSRAIVVFILQHCPAVGVWWRSFVPFQYSGTSFGAFLIGSSLWIPLNLLVSKERLIDFTIERYGNYAEKLFFKSVQENKQIQVTLSDGKVYVGYIVWSPPEPHNDCSYIGVLPTISGYRTQDTKQIVFTTSYVHIYEAINSGDERITENLETNDFIKFFPHDQIVLASIFDPDVYLLFDREDGDETENSA